MRRRAFTLVEVLVVLGIILILVTMVVSVSSALVRNAERARTETAMATMEAAMKEWEARMGRPMTFGTMNMPAGAVYDIMELNGQGRYLNVFVATLLFSDPVCAQMLAGISPEMLRPDTSTAPPVDITIPGSGGQVYEPSRQPRLEFVDSWGNRIAMVFPGRRWRVGDLGMPDPDGTVRTSDEDALGICENGRPCMISSGPDGLLGIEGGLTAEQRLAARSDNIYLYELIPVTNP